MSRSEFDAATIKWGEESIYCNGEKLLKIEWGLQALLLGSPGMIAHYQVPVCLGSINN